MNQDKAPEWAKTEVQRIYDRYEMSMSGAALRELVATLSQAYERGQVDMRERAAKVSDYGAQRAYRDLTDRKKAEGAQTISEEISNAIRSLPIDGKDALNAPS